MEIYGKEHYDLMDQFEREPEYRGRRLDREPKDTWLFLAYRRGYALGRTIAA